MFVSVMRCKVKWEGKNTYRAFAEMRLFHGLDSSELDAFMVQCKREIEAYGDTIISWGFKQATIAAR